MSARLGKVIGKFKVLELRKFLYTCYIIKFSSLLLDSFSTTRGEPCYLYKSLHNFSFLRT